MPMQGEITRGGLGGGAILAMRDQDFLLSSASWPWSSSSLRFRSSIASLLPDVASGFDGSVPLACGGGGGEGDAPWPAPNGLNMRMACSNIAMFCLPIDS